MLDRDVCCVRLEDAATGKLLKYLAAPCKLGRQNAPTAAAASAAASAGNTLSVSDGFFDSRVLSRSHAELRRDGRQLLLRDLGSSNGSFLNGTRLEPHRDYALVVGDRIDLGTTLESQQAHRKISCVVAAIDFLPLEAYRDQLQTLRDQQEVALQRTLFYQTPLDAVLFGSVLGEDQDQDQQMTTLDLLTAQNAGAGAGAASPPAIAASIGPLAQAIANQHITHQRLLALASFAKNYTNTLAAEHKPALWPAIHTQMAQLERQLEEKEQQLQKQKQSAEQQLQQERAKLLAREKQLQQQQEQEKEEAKQNEMKMVEMKNSKGLSVYWGVAVGLLVGLVCNQLTH